LLDPTQAKLEIQRIVLEGIRDDLAKKRTVHPSSAATEELAKCCYLLGQVLFALGTKDDLEAALSVFEECRQLRQSLAQNGSAQAQEALADVYDSIARTILQKKNNVGLMLGDISSSQADAAQLYRSALELRKEAAGKKSDRASLEKLASGYETYSVTLRYAKGYKEAKKESLEAAQEALRLRTRLHNTFSDWDSLSMLASAYENLGQLQCFYEMISEAGHSYGNSLQMRTALAEAAEDEASRRSLSGVYKMIGILCDYASFRDLNAIIKLIGAGNTREVREDQRYALQKFRQSLRIDEELAQELNTVEALDQYQQALFNIVTNFRSSLAEKFRCIRLRHRIRKELFSRTQNTKYQNVFLRNFIEVKRIFKIARDKFGNIVWLLPVAGVVVILLFMGLVNQLDELVASLLDMLPFPG
jgi:tetratricopeptide (TPR) repeat protein